MSHLASLERLAQLRERGALSDEEFESEKHKLLNFQSDDSVGSKGRTWFWVVAIVAGIALGLAGAAWLKLPTSPLSAVGKDREEIASINAGAFPESEALAWKEVEEVEAFPESKAAEAAALKSRAEYCDSPEAAANGGNGGCGLGNEIENAIVRCAERSNVREAYFSNPGDPKVLKCRELAERALGDDS